MKRFFCSICKKVKHVRRLPLDVIPAEMVTRRVGTCRFHTGSNPRKVVNARVRALNTGKKTTASSPALTGKKRK